MQKSAPPSRIIILGCGYIGTALAQQALDKGLDVTALTRNPDRAQALRGLGIDTVVEAQLDSENWHALIEPKADYVLNCISSAGGGLEGYRKSYVRGQQSLLRWAKDGDIGTLVYTSSTGVYPQTDSIWVTEEASTRSDSPRSKLLLEAEEQLRNCDKTCCKRWFILRLAGIYGPQRHHFLDALRRGKTEFQGFGEQPLNLIHRDDVCSAIWAAFTAPSNRANQIFNVCDNQPCPKNEVLSWLAQELGSPPPHFSQKHTSGLRREGVFDGPPPHRRISNQAIREALGWQPSYSSFKEGYAALL